MTGSAIDAPYSLKRVQEMLGLSRATVTGLIDAGFVSPEKGPRNERRFSFQDLLLLRTAFALQQASIPPRKILGALTKLKATLPVEMPLTGLRITAVGTDVVVRDRSGQWQADSGQLVMDFEVAPASGGIAILQADTQAPVDALAWFSKGELLEAEQNLEAAEAAYRRAIDLDPLLEGPYLNLGVLLCEAGRAAEAVTLYRSASERLPTLPFLPFNEAVALEDQGRLPQAIAAYRRAVDLDPTFADAHYNLGVLLERQGDAQGALRHFSAYRRLQRDEKI